MKLLFDQDTGIAAEETSPGSGIWRVYLINPYGGIVNPGPSLGADALLLPRPPAGHTHNPVDIIGGVGGSSPTVENVLEPRRSQPHQHFQSDLILDPSAVGPDTPPRNPSIYDDEFTETSLNAKWTVVTNTVAEVRYATTPSWLQAHFTGDQILTIGQAFAPGASVAFSITAKCSHTGFNAGNYAFAGISAYADANNYLQCAIQWNATTKALRTNRLLASVLTTNVQTRNLAASGHDAMYLHFQRNAGTNYKVWCSTDGIGWFPISTSETASAFAPDITEIRLHLNQAGQTAYAWAGWDWVRVNWLTL